MSSKQPLNDKELEAWESDRDIKVELVQSILEMQQGQDVEVALLNLKKYRAAAALDKRESITEEEINRLVHELR